MPHRTPLKNLLPPVPPFRVADGGSAWSRPALLVLDLQPFTAERAAGFGRMAEERGIAPELDEYYEQVAHAVRNSAELLAGFRARSLPVIFTRLAAPEPAGSVARS